MIKWKTLVAAVALIAGAVHADDRVPLPERYERVMDMTGTLTPAERAQIDVWSQQVEQVTKATLLTVMIPTLAGKETIQEYGLRVAEKFTPGLTKESKAAILIIDKDDHKVRIEANRWASVTLTDSRSREIIEDMKPSLKAGEYLQAIGVFYRDAQPLVQPEPAMAPVQSDGHSTQFWFGVIALMCFTGAGLGLALLRRKLKKEAEHAQEMRDSTERRLRENAEAAASRQAQAEEDAARLRMQAEAAAEQVRQRVYPTHQFFDDPLTPRRQIKPNTNSPRPAPPPPTRSSVNSSRSAADDARFEESRRQQRIAAEQQAAAAVAAAKRRKEEEQAAAARKKASDDEDDARRAAASSGGFSLGSSGSGGSAASDPPSGGGANSFDGSGADSNY